MTYLIESDTNYYINQKIKEIVGDIDNIVVFNLNENTIEEVLAEASYFSLFGDKKCIIVKNAKLFGVNNSSKEDSEKLLKYLNNENENTILIFTINGKADGKKKIYSLLKNNGHIYSSLGLTKTDIKNELSKIVTNNKYKIDDNSLWYIINNSVGNFDLCVNELEKIFNYYNKPCFIKYDDIINIVAKTITENNFKIIDSIISKDLDASLKNLEELRILKVEPSVIIALLYREFRLMLSTVVYRKNKISDKEIMNNLKLATWQYDKVLNNTRRYSEGDIKNEIIKLAEYDYKLKSGKIDRDVVLTCYIMDLFN